MKVELIKPEPQVVVTMSMVEAQAILAVLPAPSRYSHPDPLSNLSRLLAESVY